MSPIDYREHPNAGQHGDPAYAPESYGAPNGEHVAQFTAPQPEIKGRGYSLNELGARPNVMQPGAPEPAAPDPYTGTTIGDWDYLGQG